MTSVLSIEPDAKKEVKLTPLRLVIIGILVYIAYRLIFGGSKKNNIDNDSTSGPAKEISKTDVLVEDPICHSLVPKQQATRLDHKGETVYFCSEKCCKTFIAQQGED